MKLTPEEIEAFPHKNVIVRALGMKETVRLTSLSIALRTGMFSLCSDGLSGMITDEGMEQILNDNEDLKPVVTSSSRSPTKRWNR